MRDERLEAPVFAGVIDGYMYTARHLSQVRRMIHFNLSRSDKTACEACDVISSSFSSLPIPGLPASLDCPYGKETYGNK